jgi:hypothetical protein
MEENAKVTLWNRAVLKLALLLVVLAAFAIAAGAPNCTGCP